MCLPTSRQVNTCERAVNHKIQGWNADLREVHVDLLRAVRTRQVATIYDGKIQLCCQEAVEAALTSTSINQGHHLLNTWHWRVG